MSVLDPLTDEQREIRELVRTLARERIAPRAAEIDATAEFPWDVVELYRENDLFGIMYDEQYGGIGASALMTLVTIAPPARRRVSAWLGGLESELRSATQYNEERPPVPGSGKKL